MITPKDAKDPFAEAQAAFSPAVDAPNDDDAKRLYEAFTKALQSIDVLGGKVDLFNILLSDVNHKNKHAGRLFHLMETPLKSYNNGIATDATDAVCAKAERLWTAEIELQRLVKTVERARRAFIKSVVKETWILPLK